MEEALKGKSKCRNTAISEAFYYMGIIEGWGTGLERIQKSCKEYGLKRPVIEEFGNGFRVVFYRSDKMNDIKNGTNEFNMIVLSDDELCIINKIKKIQ